MPTDVPVTKYGEIINRDPDATEGPYTVICPADPFDGFRFTVRWLTLGLTPVTIDGNGKEIYDPGLAGGTPTIQVKPAGNSITVQFNAGLGTAGVWLVQDSDNKFQIGQESSVGTELEIITPGQVVASLDLEVSGVVFISAYILTRWVHPGAGNRVKDIDIWLELNGADTELHYLSTETLGAVPDIIDSVIWPLPFRGTIGDTIELKATNGADGDLFMRVGSGLEELYIG